MNPSLGLQSTWELTSLGSFSHTRSCNDCEGFLGHLSSCFASNEPGLRDLIRSVAGAPQRALALENQLTVANIQLNAAIQAHPMLAHQSHQLEQLNQLVILERQQAAEQAEHMKALMEERDTVKSRYTEALRAQTRIEQENRSLVAAMEELKAERDTLCGKLKEENTSLTSELDMLKEERRNQDVRCDELEDHVAYLSRQLEDVEDQRNEGADDSEIQLGIPQEGSAPQAPSPDQPLLRSPSPEEQPHTFYMVEAASPSERDRGRKRRRSTSNYLALAARMTNMVVQSDGGIDLAPLLALVLEAAMQAASDLSTTIVAFLRPQFYNHEPYSRSKLRAFPDSPEPHRTSSPDHVQDQRGSSIVNPGESSSNPVPPPIPAGRIQLPQPTIDPNPPSIPIQTLPNPTPSTLTAAPTNLASTSSVPPLIPPSWVPECAHVSRFDGKWRAGEDKARALRNEALGLPPSPDVLIETGFPRNIRQVRAQIALVRTKGNHAREVAYITSWFEATKRIPKHQFTVWMDYLQKNWSSPVQKNKSKARNAQPAQSKKAQVHKQTHSKKAPAPAPKQAPAHNKTQVAGSQAVSTQSTAGQAGQGTTAGPQALGVAPSQTPASQATASQAPGQPRWGSPVDEWARYFLSSPKAVEEAPGISQQTTLTQVPLRNVRGFILVGSRAPEEYSQRGEQSDSTLRWFKACAELIAFPGRYASLVQSGLAIASNRKQVPVNCSASFGYKDAARALAEQGVTIAEIDDAQPFGSCWITSCQYGRTLGTSMRALQAAVAAISEEAVKSLPCFEPQVYPRGCRTKVTARRSCGGNAPRRPLATRSEAIPRQSTGDDAPRKAIALVTSKQVLPSGSNSIMPKFALSACVSTSAPKRWKDLDASRSSGPSSLPYDD
ncbi:hypothetical protein ONZ45_g5051 [Pleurotus djamor]|nr:hypothetical protein ONZ45_g5051 [Pleurotus djamor]